MNKNGAVFTGMGFELVAMVLGALYLGEIIDKHLGWPGYGTMAVLLLVLGGWMYHLTILLKRFMKDEDERRSREKDK